jgi:formylglycine-generating enzyme required for sulfatase activity
MGWHKGNSGMRVHMGGQKQPNGFGLFDMHGNVSEWYTDRKGDTFYARAEAQGPDPEDSSGSPGDARVNRGGSAYHEAAYCRSASRHADRPGDQESDHGFRPTFYPLQ